MNDNENKNNVDVEEQKPDLKVLPKKSKPRDEEPIKCDESMQAPPSNIYQVLMASMTPEHLAVMGTQLVQVNGRELFWMTSVGQLYPFDAKQQAVQAEYNWLMSAPNK